MKRPKDPHTKIQKRHSKHGVRWQGIVIYYDPDTGRRRQLAKTFPRQREAEDWAKKEEVQFRSNPNRRPPTDLTVSEFMDHWLEIKKAKPVGEGTLESYRYRVKNIRDFLGDRPLKTLLPVHVQEFYLELSKQYPPRTCAYVSTLLRAALETAVNLDLIPSNPARRVPKPQTVARERTALTLHEAQTVLRMADSHRFRAMWWFIALTGVRKGEALGLRWEDFTSSFESVTIRRTASGSGQKRRRVTTPKTDRANRTVAIPAILAEILTEHRARQQTLRQAAGEDWQETGLVFTTSRGTLIDPRYASSQFKNLLKNAGLSDTWRIHDLRHAMATHWLASGISPKVVSERLGHSSVAFTLQVYGHVLPNQQAEAAERVAATLVDDEFINSSSTRASGSPSIS